MWAINSLTCYGYKHGGIQHAEKILIQLKRAERCSFSHLEIVLSAASCLVDSPAESYHTALVKGRSELQSARLCSDEEQMQVHSSKPPQKTALSATCVLPDIFLSQLVAHYAELSHSHLFELLILVLQIPSITGCYYRDWNMLVELIQLHTAGFNHSYRFYFVHVNNYSSFHTKLSDGIPQGSVLGLILFN